MLGKELKGVELSVDSALMQSSGAELPVSSGQS